MDEESPNCLLSACLDFYFVAAVLDIILFFVIQPVCGVLFFACLNYVYDSFSDDIKLIILAASTIIYISMYSAPVPLYKFVREKVTSDRAFSAIANVYIYVNGFVGIIFMTGIYEIGMDTENDALVTIFFTIISWWALLYLNCRPHIAGGFGSYPHIKNTPENLLLFPNTRFQSKVSLLFFDSFGLIPKNTFALSNRSGNFE